MNRITEIEECIWAGQSIEQLAFRYSDATKRVEIVRAVRRFLVKQTISPGKSVRAQLALEVVDLALIITEIPFARQMFQPDRIAFQSAQTEHPLQRHRKIAAALEIFRREPAAEKNRHQPTVDALLFLRKLRSLFGARSSNG